MHITLKIVGGFTGPAAPQTYTLDSEELPQESTARLRELLGAANFFNLDANIHHRPVKSWDFDHQLTVSDGNNSHEVHFHLDAVPGPLRVLCEKVIEIAAKKEQQK